MKRPNFFIIGAPKCGTTALASWLSSHPKVFFSPRKEPHYFNEDGLRATGGIEEYEALFEGALSSHDAVGEGSTHYLYSREAVPRILDYAPDARFIVCLRNPVEMAPALHGERLKQGRENVRSFEKAWRLQRERRNGRYIPSSLREDPERLQYGAYCRLGEQMSRLLNNAPRERVLPVLLDDIRSDGRLEYLRVMTFLGVPDDGRQEFRVINAGSRTRISSVSLFLRRAATLKGKAQWLPSFGVASKLSALNQAVGPRAPLLPTLRAELQEYFREDVARLGEILNRDLSRWVQ